MKTLKQLKVTFDDGAKRQDVGTLASLKDGRTAFEYADSWLAYGFSISPFSLPLRKEVFIAKPDPFDGMFGVFNDSLPDGWGRLLVDRCLRKSGTDPAAVNELNRLAIVGNAGSGALAYEPIHELAAASRHDDRDFDCIARECAALLGDRQLPDASLDELFRRAGSSGGARPKIFARINEEDCIIKFPSSIDEKDSGLREYQYSLCARKCGITMEKTKLFPSNCCKGYFGTLRFDRVNGRRIHMVSAGGLLEASHRFPCLDYASLMRLTLELTRDFTEVEQMFRRMCFNVLAHNRDDHAKNFSFLSDDTMRTWRLSPAYDLTYSSSLNGEHATSVNGEGASPDINDILAVARDIGLDENESRRTAESIRRLVSADLFQGKATLPF